LLKEADLGSAVLRELVEAMLGDPVRLAAMAAAAAAADTPRAAEHIAEDIAKLAR